MPPSWYICGNERYRGPVASATQVFPDPLAVFGANLVAWWDADTAIGGGLSGGTTAPDLSGHSHPLTIGGSPSPTVNATGINGHPSYSFTNTGGSGTGGLFAVSSGSLSFPGLGAAGAMFMAANINLAFGGSFPYLWTAESCLSIFDLFNVSGDVVAATPVTRTVCNGNVAQSAVTDTTNYIFCFAWDSTNIYLYINNVLVAGPTSAGGTINVGNGGNCAFSLGLRGFDSATSTCLNGNIGAGFVVNVTPSGGQLTSAYNYLHSRFGIGP